MSVATAVSAIRYCMQFVADALRAVIATDMLY
jgi:hypothetical protein